MTMAEHEDDEADKWSDETTRKIVQVWNERGHAGSAAHNDNVFSGSKAATEAAWAVEWAHAAREQLGLAVTDVWMNASDPPDAFAIVEGCEVSVELAEFVDGDLISRLKAQSRSPGQEDRQATSHHQPFFTAAQWTRNKFIAHLNLLIDGKHAKYTRRNLVFDFLVIYSAEPWLYSRDVRQWSADSPIGRRESFLGVHFLLDYEPGAPGCHPVARVY